MLQGKTSHTYTVRVLSDLRMLLQPCENTVIEFTKINAHEDLNVVKVLVQEKSILDFGSSWNFCMKQKCWARCMRVALKVAHT
jgi:hypothetical protein